MKKFVNRSLSALLERYFSKVDTDQVSSLISNGQYEEKNISLNPSLFQNFKIPFFVNSSKISSFKIDTSSSNSTFLIDGISLIASYSDCFEFNPYVVNPPSLSFFLNKFFSEKTVKKMLFSFLFKIEKVNFSMKNGYLHFEIPRCEKIGKDNSKENNPFAVGSFGFIFDEISLSESNFIKISKLSIYVFSQSERMNNEKYELFKENLVNNQNNSFILQNFDYEGQINDLQISKEIVLNFNFSQIFFLKLFSRKLYYSNCGCPNVYTKDSCLGWWNYSYRCFLKDRHCFNFQSAISFLKNRRTFNPNFERDQFLMFNTYKKSSYSQTNSDQSNTNFVDFTSDEKEGFVNFCDQSNSSSIKSFDFKISFLKNLKIKVRNTLNGELDLGQITIEKKDGSTLIRTDKINMSYEFLPFLFKLIKEKFIIKLKDDKEFKISIPLLKINNGNYFKDPIGSIKINNFEVTEKGFSVNSIQNYNNTLNLTNIDAKEDSESTSLKKKYTINIDDMKLTTKILFNLFFYKDKSGNYSSPKQNLHSFLYLFNEIEYILSVENSSLYIGNDSVDFLSFKIHFVNTFKSLVIGVDNISFGKILQNFYFTATINYDNEGRSIFFDLDKINVSLFSSEIPILLNLLTEIKPLIYKYIKTFPQIECLIFASKGFCLTLEMPEYSLVQLNISECTLKSLSGFTQFSIENNHALFYDKKLSKWCMLIQPFNITSNVQRTNIDLNLSLQFNFTRVFFNDINKFFTCKDERVDIPRKVKIKNLTSYKLLLEEKKEINKGKEENKNNDDDDNENQSDDDDDEENKNDENPNEEEENANENNDHKINVDVNGTVFMNSKKFRIEIENPNSKSNESYMIDSSHLQFPLYISNKIVLSNGENSICFCSPFVFVNKSSFKNICIYEISKGKNSNSDDFTITLAGCLNSKGSKLGLYHPNVFITGETDIGNQIFANYIHEEANDEGHKYKMLPIIMQTIDKKPHLIDIIYNGNKETLLVASEFNFEKGALFVYLMNPFVIVNHVSECKSVSLSLSTTIINPKEKKKWGKKNAEDEDQVINSEIENLLPYEKASIPLKMIPSCLSFFQIQQQKGKIKTKIVNNSFNIIVKLNDFLGIPGNTIQSKESHIVVSNDFQFYPIQFSEKKINFSLALKIQFNPRKGNWSFILFAPSVIENRTNLDISINSVGKTNITNFFVSKKDEKSLEKPNRLIFGCDSFFHESRSMPVFIGYNREFKLSDKPIELCFAPFSAPLLLPSIIHKKCYLPLYYKTSSMIENEDEKSMLTNQKKKNHFNELFTVIDFYKIVENCTSFDFTLTPIDDLSNQNIYTTFEASNENSDNNKNKMTKKDEIDENSDDENSYPEILFKMNEKKPISFATSSFCFKFKYKESVLPICLLKDNYRTCFRVDKTKFVLLTITEKVVRFEMSDFSPQKVFMTFTNLVATESILINSSPSQPPIIIEPNTTTLFGFDSPFESTNISIFGLNDQIDFRVDRCYEPLSSSMNKFIVQTISKQNIMNPSEIVHSIIVRMNSYDTESNQQESLVLNSPNGEYLNADSNLKGAMRISIEQESEDELRNTNNQNEESIENFNEDDSVLQSLIMSQYSDQIGNSYDIDDYDCFAGYSLTVNVPIFEISLIDDRLTELALVCLYQSAFKFTNDRSLQTKSIQFSIKSLQVFDMNVMTLFPTVISSNPENGNFFAIEINYFDKITVDQLKVTISPILISPDINFLNELCYFFRKINNASSIVNKINSNSLLCQSKLFNLVQIDPIIIVINIKTQSSRKLNTPKIVTFNKNLTTSFAINGFIVHNADACPSFFISIINHLCQMKLNYAKIFYLQNPNEIPLQPKHNIHQRVKQNASTPIQTLLSPDLIEERIENATVYSHFFSFPSLTIDPLIEKNLKDKPAKILEALSQTESYFKLASDKMRLISNDKIDRDEYLIPPRKRRTQNAVSSTTTTTISSSLETSGNNGSETKIQGSVKKEKTANAAQTVANGFSSAAKSLGSGITGIIRKPIQGGKENGAKGAFKGIGQGLLGVLTCTVSSVIEVGSGIAGGIRKSIIKDNTSNYEQCRPPSTFLLRCITTNSANNNAEKNVNNRIKEDVINNFNDEVVENAELAQQAINSGQIVAVNGEMEESLLFFSNVKKNQKRIAFIGITKDYIFLFNSNLSVLNKFDLESITWFKKKSDSLSNNDVDYNLDTSLRRKIVFDQFNKVNQKSTRYELELPSENNASLAVQFFSSKLRIFDIIREEQDKKD